MHWGCYCHDMANLQVKNIPDALHERLRRHARQNDTTISSVVLTAIERELAWANWRERFARHPKTDPVINSVTTLREERTLRDREIG